MSDSKTVDDGGPAFPQGHLDGPHVNPSGMSLRDWFAGQALSGYMTIVDDRPAPNYQYDARLMYELADAMLAARKEPQSEAITGR